MGAPQAHHDRAAMASPLSTAPQQQGQPPPGPLPPLREDLVLAEGASLPWGAPTWTIYDPSMHRYVRIGWLEFEILSRWGLKDPAAVAQSVSEETTLRPTAEDVASMAAFAMRAGLVQPTGPGGTASLLARSQAHRHGPATWLLHNYLFLRMRLVDPDRFLADMMPLVGWMFSRTYVCLLGATALLGLFLVSREWQAYVHGLADMLSLKGAVGIVAALCASKVIHELGHGFAAKRLGCRVPAMGIAFLVMAPVLWTDVTDAWRLRRRRDRLLVDAAGMLAEISLASLATVLWAVLPDGPARGGMLVLSGSTWILTLLVNINPLMRFDGYYILSDLVDVPNLQERGFMAARWRLREWLFGVGDPEPERFRGHVGLAVYAWAYATWIYRFSLFLGIALLVYHMAFKALGFFLMGIEIWFFLARPILRELFTWRRKVVATGINRHSIATLSVVAALAALAVVPWQDHVEAPAVMRAASQAVLYAEQPGRLASVPSQGQRVHKGEVVFHLQSLEVGHSLAVAQARLAGLDAQIRGQTFDEERAEDINVSIQELQRATAELADARIRQEELNVTAPFDGTVTDIAPGIRVGADVPRRESMAMLVDAEHWTIEAYVAEADLPRMRIGSTGYFLPESGGPEIRATVNAITNSSVRNFEAPELASANGGSIPTRKDASNATVTETAEYRILLTPLDGQALPERMRRQRGMVAIEGDRESLIGRAWRKAIAVVVRETGL
jgi:putative peptide zinc metalloprotease protein